MFVGRFWESFLSNADMLLVRLFDFAHKILIIFKGFFGNIFDRMGI